MLTVAKSLPYFILCICLVGFSFGGLLVVFAPIVKNVFGSRFYHRNYGLIFIGYGIGAFVGPEISASFYDSTGSMWWAILAPPSWLPPLLCWCSPPES